MLFSLIIIIIYCRKKCTRQSLKVLWVVLSALFFKEIWKNGTEGHGHMFASAKGKKQQYVRQLQSSRTMYWSYPILSFGIDVCIFLPTTFLEIAVWFKSQLAGGNRLAFFNHDRGVELATVEKHFQLVVKAVFKPRKSGLPDWHAGYSGMLPPERKAGEH